MASLEELVAGLIAKIQMDWRVEMHALLSDLHDGFCDGVVG